MLRTDLVLDSVDLNLEGDKMEDFNQDSKEILEKDL